jgi:predicted nucleic acid-binding protein
VAFVALFDANVLYPAPLRDLLIRLARTGLFRARWSEKINDEWITALLRTRPELADRLARTRLLLNRAIDDCLIEGYETLIPALSLPDPDDHHVLAAAIVGGVDVIVTQNLRDFPAAALAPFRIDAQHPDTFIRHVLDLDEAVALSAVREARGALKDPPKTAEEFLDTLAQQGLAESVAFLRARHKLL